MIDSGSSLTFQIILLNIIVPLLYCILPIFTLYQVWNIGKYIKARITRKQMTPPVFSIGFLSIACLALSAVLFSIINQ